MKFIKLKINNQYLIVPKLFKDQRGIFNRSYCLETLKKRKLNFIAKQGNISENPYKGTLRGFHYQNNSKDSKIISCISGKMLNITIDIRKNSSSYLSITKNVLSLPGVPSILNSMIDNSRKYLIKGLKVHNKTINLYTVESNIAKNLGKIQKKYKKFVDIGSYPFFRLGKIGVAIVTRSTSIPKLKKVSKELIKLAKIKNIKILKL